ncbi:MAG: toll/interleukin-1 receptor domain-containing protein [Chitinophagales bacterium]
MKDTIFISHANPQDNYFASWLASKLRLLGYQVWVDVRDIKPGQYFNRDFEAVIRDQSIRFLAVVSKDYISKAKISDTGVMNEILCARTIKDVQDFIIPLKYDETDYAQFGSGLIGRFSVWPPTQFVARFYRATD